MPSFSTDKRIREMVTSTHPFYESEKQCSSCSLGTSQLKPEPQFYSLALTSWLSRERLLKYIHLHTRAHTHRARYFWFWWQLQKYRRKWARNHVSCYNWGSLDFLPCTLDRGNRLCLSSFHQSFMYLKANVISPFRRFFFRVNYSRLFNFSS